MGFTEALDATNEKYLAHFGKTAVALKAICEEAEIPLDASGVNAVAFTTYKATKDAFGHMPTKATEGGEAAAKAAPSKGGDKGRILKLENEGDEAYVQISECARVEGNFGPQYVFAGALQPSGEDIRLFIGSATVERQLEFIGLTAEATVGQVIHFSRARNPKGKPFWNLKVAKFAPKKATKSFEDAPEAPDDGFPF